MLIDTDKIAWTKTREIIKDIEDIEGDLKIGCKSIPIVLGVYNTKFISFILIIITGVSIVLSYTQYLSKLYLLKADSITMWYVILLNTILFVLIFIIFKGKERKHFHFASVLVKIIMLLGMSYSLILFYLITK